MGRPRKPEIGSQRWAENELRLAENRLRQVRRLIDTAGEAELPSLLRLETSLRRETERLAKLAAPQLLTEQPWYGDSRALEELVLGEESDDE